MGNNSWVSLQGQIKSLKQNPQKMQAINGISIQTTSSVSSRQPKTHRGIRLLSLQ